MHLARSFALPPSTDQCGVYGQVKLAHGTLADTVANNGHLARRGRIWNLNSIQPALP